MITIQIDYRERKSGLIELLKQAGCCIRMTHLETGDYLINKEITVERKTANDFILSIIDGRLFRQVAGMKRKCQRPLVLIEGNPFRNKSNITSEAIRGALISVQAIWYVPIVYSKGVEDSKEILMTLGNQSLKYQNVLHMRHGYRPKRTKSRQLHVLQGFPGIGPELAVRLMERYGSLRMVFEAVSENLAQIKGIGSQRADNFCRLLDTEYDLNESG